MKDPLSGLERGVHGGREGVAEAGPVHHLVAGHGPRPALAPHPRHGRLQPGLGGGDGWGGEVGHEGAGHRVLDPAPVGGVEGGQGVGGVPVARDGGRAS